MVTFPTVGSTGLPASPSSSKSVVSSGTTSTSSIAPQSVTSVTLGQTGMTAVDQMYSPNGSLLSVLKPIQIWERVSNDALSTLMATNFASRSSSFGFKDLGAALLERFKNGTEDSDNFSQSIIQFAPDAEPSEILETITRSQLHTRAENQVSLKIQTVGGAQVELTLGSQENGMALQVQVTGGTLTDADRNALAKLSGAFQDAIDGLAQEPPRLNLTGLMKFDSTVLSSVSLHTSLTTAKGENQILDFQADSKQRSVSTSGPIGSMKVNVDLTNPTIIGNAKQQAKAVDNYLKQFDAAQKRGHGDAALMTIFKDAFAGLNSNYPALTAQQRAEAVATPSIQFSQLDRSVLTGLADFSASVTQNSESNNPYRLDERDTFSYQLSQDSSIKGRNQLDRSIAQKQQSNLSASYHEPLTGSQPLMLTTEIKSQNYNFYQINDEASSTAAISYEKGAVVNASLIQSASQSSQLQKYVTGKLTEDKTTSRQASQSEDFLALFKASTQGNDAKAWLDSYLGQQALSTINDLVFLQPDPTQLEEQSKEKDLALLVS